MIEKQCQFRGRDDAGVYFHLLRPGYQDSIDMVKYAQASPPLLDEVRTFLKNADRQNGRLWVLVTALGAWEFWGQNSNGDAFPEASLIHTPEGWKGLDHKMQVMTGQNWEWGFPTFYNAHVFQHHQNKDPKRAFGNVEYSCWDPEMKRVLLVLSLDRTKAQQEGSIGVVDKIDNGEYPDLSMGCRVPYDLCLRCTDWPRITGNAKRDLAEHKRNPIRGLSVVTGDYCQHLRFENGRIHPDGVRVGMLNLHPRFFDISFVFIGADKASKVMAKLAGVCPLRPDHKQCGGGCWECDIPSAHVHRVWHGIGDGMRKTASAEYGDDHKTEKAVNAYFTKRRGAVKRAGDEAEGAVGAIDNTSPASGYSKLAELEELRQAFATGATKLADLDLAKQGEIIKRIQSHFNTALPSIEEKEPDIPKVILRLMGKDPSMGLATAGSMGIVVKPREFQRIMLVRMGRENLADDLDREGVCFRCGGHHADPEFSMPGDIIGRLVQALAPLIGGRSAFEQPLARRSMTIVVVRKPRSEPVMMENQLLDKFGSAYQAYREQLLCKVAGLVPRLIHEYPAIYEQVLGIDPFSSPEGVGIVKAGGDVVQSLIGMFPSMYMNGVYMPGPVSAYVADRPSYAGLRQAEAVALSGRVA